MCSGAAAGFTLIEIVLAISILAIIMTVSYSALYQITVSKQALDDARDVKVIASSVLRRLTRELQLAYTQAVLMPPPENLTSLYPSRTFMRGASPADGADSTFLTFLALEGGQYVPDGTVSTGLVQITYRVERPPAEERDEDTYYLVREEVPYMRPFDDAYRQRMVFPVTSRITELQFRFLDLQNDRWVESWGEGDRLGLPPVVKFTIVLRSPRGRDYTFTSSVALRSEEVL